MVRGGATTPYEMSMHGLAWVGRAARKKAVDHFFLLEISSSSSDVVTTRQPTRAGLDTVVVLWFNVGGEGGGVIEELNSFPLPPVRRAGTCWREDYLQHTSMDLDCNCCYEGRH